MKLLLIAVTLIGATNAVLNFDPLKSEWHIFKLQHGKNYENDIEEQFRMKIFLDNKRKIEKHNEKYEKGLVSFKLGLNKYADMLHSEFLETMNGLKDSGNLLRLAANKEHFSKLFSPAGGELPDFVDWREKGAVTRVKDQGHRCGSCWAFSTTGSLEGQHFLKTGVLVELSEQNLVDCSHSFGNLGCFGGSLDGAFEYIKSNGGIDTEKSYPYEGTNGTCRYNKTNIGATIRGYVEIPSGDEELLKKAVATVGPVSVAIDYTPESFKFYSEGVYYEPECDSDFLTHGVLVVGYGTDESGNDYWIVKNSYSPSWGDEGYIKMSRNRDNNCGIASTPIYPLV